MKTYSKTVFISAKDARKTWDFAKLVSAAVDGSAHGVLEVTVVAVDGQGEVLKDFDEETAMIDTDGFSLVGNAMAVEKDDDLAAVNERLARDLGTIGAVQSDELMDGYKSGDPFDFYWVANHKGLPLAYGDALKAPFKKVGDRNGAQTKIDAMKWAIASKNMELMMLASSNMEELVRRYKATL
jgi:hypothetical protein